LKDRFLKKNKKLCFVRRTNQLWRGVPPRGLLQEL